MKAELVPENGDPPIPITRDLTIIGRRPFCDVQIDQPGLSKRHCVLVRTDGLLMVRDLATTNGTKVNGQKILWAALLPNDRLTLGGYKVRVYLGSDDAPSPSEKARASGKASAHPASSQPLRSAGAVARTEAPAVPFGFATPTPSDRSPLPTLPVSPSDDGEAEVFLDLESALVEDDDG